MSEAAPMRKRTNYARGAEVEYRAKRELEKAGYYVMRSSASHGVFDLIAVGHGEILLIQCKRTKTKAGPGSYKADIQQMQECVAGLTLPAYCRVVLWIWTDFVGWSKHDVIQP